jgi:hypothetical protein
LIERLCSKLIALYESPTFKEQYELLFNHFRNCAKLLETKNDNNPLKNDLDALIAKHPKLLDVNPDLPITEIPTSDEEYSNDILQLASLFVLNNDDQPGP